MTERALQSSAEQAQLQLSAPGLFRQAAYIDGRWVTAPEAIEVFNPATGGVLGTVPALSGIEAQAAISAAHRAFSKWRATGASFRATILRRWFELLIQHREDLARLMTAEQGKPLEEARGEITYAASFVEWFAEEARRVYGDVIPGHQADKRLIVMKQPVGVVAAITPWNFPAAMITRKVAPALAVGCTVVLKPSELTPFSALALAYLAEQAGVPPGVFNVLTGNPQDIGQELTGDARIRKFTFTGSTRIGKRLAAQCMNTVKRISLELGGNAPLIVFDDADLATAVEGAMASKFRNTGQTCVCANRILVQSGIHDRFVTALAKRAESLVVGDGLRGETQQGPLINDAAVQKVERHVQNAISLGGKVITGGARLAGLFYKPTVISGVTAEMELFKEETFGPVAGILKFGTEDEAIRIANDTSAGLAAYVFTKDFSRSFRVCEALEYGMVGLNTGLISTAVAPFGGVKESGIGREGSAYGVDEYVDTRLICAQVDATAPAPLG